MDIAQKNSDPTVKDTPPPNSSDKVNINETTTTDEIGAVIDSEKQSKQDIEDKSPIAMQSSISDDEQDKNENENSENSSASLNNKSEALEIISTDKIEENNIKNVSDEEEEISSNENETNIDTQNDKNVKENDDVEEEEEEIEEIIEEISEDTVDEENQINKKDIDKLDTRKESLNEILNDTIEEKPDLSFKNEISTINVVENDLNNQLPEDKINSTDESISNESKSNIENNLNEIKMTTASVNQQINKETIKVAPVTDSNNKIENSNQSEIELEKHNRTFIDENIEKVYIENKTQTQHILEPNRIIKENCNTFKQDKWDQLNDPSQKIQNKTTMDQQQQHLPASEINQENIKTTLKEIISDIDRVIEQEEQHKKSMSSKMMQNINIGPSTQYTTLETYYKRNEFKESDENPKSKNINLEKIFTPANDTKEILPKNRKLYSSSAFYSPSLHPTLDDQVELARKISSSLSDISNQHSKGQTMYVNRKKRSVKWAQEGKGKAEVEEYSSYSEQTNDGTYETMSKTHEKTPLKLIMNPRGHIQDVSTSPNHGINTSGGLLSPLKCAELVSALNAPQGKGAELFAKRRKKAENWIVEAPNKATNDSLPGIAYLNIDQQSTDYMQQYNPIEEKYSVPKAKLEKQQWLKTGSVYDEYPSYGMMDTLQKSHYDTKQVPLLHRQPPNEVNSQRDLAYKPSIPQGWNAPPPNLPKEDPSLLSSSNLSLTCASNNLKNDKNLDEKTFKNKLQLFEKNLQKNDKKSEEVDMKKVGIVSQKKDILKAIEEDANTVKTSDYYDQRTVKTPLVPMSIYTQLKLEQLEKSKNDNKDIININEKKHDTVSKSYKEDDEILFDITKSIIHELDLINQKKTKENDKAYVQIPVKELISTFENQKNPIIRFKTIENTDNKNKEKLNLQQIENDDKFDCDIKQQNVVNKYNENDIIEVLKDEIDKKEGLYTPPEIPLESYAPPPQIVSQGYKTSMNGNNNSSYLSSIPYNNYPDYISTNVFPMHEIFQIQQEQPQRFPLKKSNINTKNTWQQNKNTTKYQGTSPLIFNPSPLPSEKLAKFEQRTQQQQHPIKQYRQKSPIVHNIRKPLAIQGTQIRNLSPIPYFPSSISSAKASIKNDIYGFNNFPADKYFNDNIDSNNNNNNNNNYIQNGLKTISPQSSPNQQYYQQKENYNYNNNFCAQQYSPRLSSVDLCQCPNYNTAPRGWSQTKNFYRPVTFSKPCLELPYSDF